MNVDPSMNVVVFEVSRKGKKETLMGQGTTRASNCVQTVWSAIQQEHGVRPDDVQQIFSEWEPSPEDIAFLDKHFPDNVNVSYSFERPADDQWDKALEEVKQIILQSLTDKAAETAQTERKDFVPLPILRNVDQFSEVIVHKPLVPGLAVFLAQVGTTPRGTIGIDYVMAKSLQEQGVNANQLWEQAFTNLNSGLKVNVAKQDGEQLFILKRQDGMAASAIALPSFPKNATKWVGSSRLIVGIPDPDTVMMGAANSRVVRHIQETILKSNYGGAVNLTPCLLLLENGGWSLQSRRQTQ